MPPKVSTDGEWTVEEFYFGNANYPSEATYRHSGARLQVRVEASLRLIKKADGQYEKDTEGLAVFLDSHQDCKLVFREGHDVHPSYGGGRTEPTAWIMGWQDVTTEKGRWFYERDKRTSM